MSEPLNQPGHGTHDPHEHDLTTSGVDADAVLERAVEHEI